MFALLLLALPLTLLLSMYCLVRPSVLLVHCAICSGVASELTCGSVRSAEGSGRIYVGNLPESCDTEKLREFFSKV